MIMSINGCIRLYYYNFFFYYYYYSSPPLPLPPFAIPNHYVQLQVLELHFAQHGFVGPVTQSFQGRVRDVIKLLDSGRFDVGPPFTIQRYAEILSDPATQYKSTHKLINGLEKLLYVNSTIYDVLS